MIQETMLLPLILMTILAQKNVLLQRMNASIINSTFSTDGSRYYVYIRTRINVCLVRRALFRRDMMDASGDAKVEMAVTASGTKCRISIRQEMDGSIHGTLITIKSRAYTNANARSMTGHNIITPPRENSYFDRLPLFPPSPPR